MIYVASPGRNRIIVVRLPKFWPSVKQKSSDETDDIHNKFMSVVFTLIGTTQGLALGALAERIPNDLQLSALYHAIIAIEPAAALQHMKHSFIRLSNFALCFFIIARVTQTYICGALSYVQKIFSFWDLTSILAVGVMQYSIMNSIPKEGTDSGNLYLKLFALALLALALHAYTAMKELKHGDNPYPITMQIYNMIFSALISSFSFSAYYTDSDMTRATLSVFIIITISTNIMMSLADTDFSGMTREILYKTQERRLP